MCMIFFLTKDHFLACLVIFDCDSCFVHSDLWKPGDLNRRWIVVEENCVCVWQQPTGTTRLGSLRVIARISALLKQFQLCPAALLLALLSGPCWQHSHGLLSIARAPPAHCPTFLAHGFNCCFCRESVLISWNLIKTMHYIIQYDIIFMPLLASESFRLFSSFMMVGVKVSAVFPYFFWYCFIALFPSLSIWFLGFNSSFLNNIHE